MTPKRAQVEGLGAVLRDARKRRGWTQAQAADALGTHVTQIARYESGQREPPLSFIRRAETAYERGVLDATPPGVSRGTIHAVRERPTRPYQAGDIGARDLRGALWAIEQMSLALADISRRAREASD